MFLESVFVAMVAGSVQPSPALPSVPYGDTDGDRISDSLAARLLKGGPERIRVGVLMKAPVTEHSLDLFEKHGGQLVHGPFRWALHGYAGTIPAREVRPLVESDPELRVVEDDSTPLERSLVLAGRQVGARNRVWPVLGLTGSPDTSIAVIDTGIDAGHPTFGPGYGEADFGKKVIAWRDFTYQPSLTPFDSDGHGTHVAAIAAGGGFRSIDSGGRLLGTDAFRTRIPGATMHWGGFWVTRPGTIQLDIGYVGRFGTLKSLVLYRGNGVARYSAAGIDRQVLGWTEVARLNQPTPSTGTDALTFSTLSHPVAAGEEGLYHIVTVRSQIGGGFAGSIPYEVRIHAPGSPVDESPPLRGIAPGCRIIAVRAEHPSDWAAALDFLVENRSRLHACVVNLSQGSRTDSALLHNAAVAADRAGLLLVAAAGNSGPAKPPANNMVDYPARIPEVLAVGAINAADGVTAYSSQGGMDEMGMVKPDLAAPGGSSALQGGIWSADSSTGNTPGNWGVDLAPGDAAPIQGTSQAAPMVAGAAALVLHALGGWKAVESAPEPARVMQRVKLLLMATASEVWPVQREPTPTWPEPASVSPTFDAPDASRPAKDAHEGYGRLNADAAVEAALPAVKVGRDPTRIDADMVGAAALMGPGGVDLEAIDERRCLARAVDRAGGFHARVRCTAELSVGLFVYDAQPGPAGEPRVLGQKISGSPGMSLGVLVPPGAGAPIVVVKALAGRGRVSLTLERVVHR